MTPRTCLTCGAQCPRAGSDGRPTDEDCWEPCASAPIKRVYVAGPMSGMPADYLFNCGELLRAWAELSERGMVAFCPAADLLLGLHAPRVLDVQEYRDASMAWLEVSDAVLVIGTHHRDGRPSEGVHDEIARANELRIPVCYSMEELLRLRGTEPT